MLGGDVVLFRDVLIQVVKLQRLIRCQADGLVVTPAHHLLEIAPDEFPVKETVGCVLWSAEQRRQNAYLYNRYLNGSGVVTPVEIPEAKAVYHLYVVRVNDGKREKLQDYLKSFGIATGIHYPIALPNLTAYEYLKHKEADFAEASKASREILSLPMFPELEEEQIAFVAEKIKEFTA